MGAREITQSAQQKNEILMIGEGDGDVRKIVKDLLNRGYDGGFSMEPHLKVIAHDTSKKSTDYARYAAYIEYGKRFEKIIEEIRMS